MAHKESETMDIQEVAPYIGCSVSKCRKLAKDKKLPHRKLGNRYIFDRHVIELWKKSKYAERGFKYEFKQYN